MSTTLQIPALNARALVVPDSWQPKTGDITLEWGSEDRALSFDEWGDPFLEQLSFDPAHVRLERINGSGSVIDSHGRSENRFGSVPLKYRVGGVIKAWIDSAAARGMADVRLLVTKKTEDLRASFDQGIPPGVSVGYRVFAYRDITEPGDEMRVMLAVDWEPFEITMTPIPADATLSYRSAAVDQLNPCTFPDKKMPQPTKNKPAKPEATKGDGEQESAVRLRALFTAEADIFSTEEVDVFVELGIPDERARALIAARKAAVAAAEKGAGEPAELSAADGGQPSAADAERGRALAIAEVGQQHKLTPAFITEHIKKGTSADRFRALVLNQLAVEQENAGDMRNAHTQIQVGTEQETKVLESMGRALEHRAGVKVQDEKGAWRPIVLDDGARRFRGMSLLRMGEECLRLRGQRVDDLDQDRLIGRSLALGLSDFPNLLSNTGNKALQMAYMSKPQRWRKFATEGDVKDFKVNTRHQLGDAPSLKPVGENGEIELGKMSEKVESYAIDTNARRIALTRKAIVNDDLGAFARLVRAGGNAARRREDAIVWALLTGNPTMGDGLPLFDAGHSNIGSGVINVANVGLGIQAMMQQTGIANADGEADQLEIEAAFLLVPTSKMTVAKQFVNSMLAPAAQADVNPYQDLEVIASSYLEASSSLQWYLVANPSDCEVLEFAYLNGVQGPQLTMSENTNTDGIEFVFKLDFGAGMTETRGVYRSTGA